MITKALIWFFNGFKLYCLSLSSLATASAVNAFANSEGCRPIKPKLYQEVAPFMLFPKIKSPANESIDAKYKILAYFS